MKQHILLEKAFCYPEPATLDLPADCIFEERRGYWKNKYTGEIMMLSNDPRRPQTKKYDVETGEDQKGE